ncbi:DUF192 domain-containing protein [Virgibacillus byunsanensis]|uniref:DUF192 domain-containing protein n=1 Tax=Virgibacillus byunsanensis TaxID=570945 RepID=A0ABW3LH41_9BACI
MKLVNLSNDKVIAETVNQAYSFVKRLKGLMFTDKLESGTGVHIRPCQSVHTFFMNYSIDIIYLNKANIVVAIDEALPPGKVGGRYADAVSVIELPTGTTGRTETKVGDELIFIS